MSIICSHCGKTVEGEGLSFCPYCGFRMEAPGAAAGVDSEAAAWIAKAMEVSSIPKRKEILEQALKACPDSRDLRWEMLFVGEKDPKPPKGRMDFSIIKSSVLLMYRFPDDYKEEKKNRMRELMFTDPALLDTLRLYENPDQKHVEYLERLCEEFIKVFMEDDNRLMGNFLGFRLNRNKEKQLAPAAAEMIRRIRTDAGLSLDQRNLLAEVFYRSYSVCMGGKTEYLDAELG